MGNIEELRGYNLLDLLLKQVSMLCREYNEIDKRRPQSPGEESLGALLVQYSEQFSQWTHALQIVLAKLDATVTPLRLAAFTSQERTHIQITIDAIMAECTHSGQLQALLTRVSGESPGEARL